MDAHEKVEIVNKYINGVNSEDMNAIREIFDEQATIEDPIGTDAHVGIEAFSKFYENAFVMGVKLESTGAVRCAGNAAVFPFVARTPSMEIEVIEIFEFNENGKVKSMRAYWGPDNCSTL